jgi:uncharacterized repeat protein (TIGR01451 family)
MRAHGSLALSCGRTLLAGAFALVCLWVGPAFAGVGGGAGPTWPATLPVGASVSAFIDIVNASDGVNGSENIDILQISFTPSCAAQNVGTCTTPDLGVITLAPIAVGDPTSSCKNTIFTLVGPTVAGVYTLSPSAPVHLGPADGSGGAANPKNCRMVVNATVAKLPVDSTPPNPPLTTIQFARVVLRGHTSQSSGAANGQGTIAITPVSNLTVTKTDGSTTYTPGTQAVYTIVVGNLSGPSDAIEATVSDTKPTQITSWTWVCSGTSGGATGCDGAASSAADFTDTVNLPVGSTITYTVTANIDSDASGVLFNAATVAPPSLATNLGTACTAAGSTFVAATGGCTSLDMDTPVRVVDLSIVKTDGSATYLPGGTLTYTITVTNEGPSHVFLASVRDILPTAITSATWTCTASVGSSCTAASGSDSISNAVSLLRNGTATFVVTANISAAATGNLVNAASVTPPPMTPNLGTACMAAGSTFSASDGSCSSTDTDTPAPVTVPSFD